jgi:hypothetical protein
MLQFGMGEKELMDKNNLENVGKRERRLLF